MHDAVRHGNVHARAVWEKMTRHFGKVTHATGITLKCSKCDSLFTTFYRKQILHLHVLRLPISTSARVSSL
jgi:hypothetical protein